MNNEYQKPWDSNRREEKETSRPKGVDAVASCCRPSCLYYVAFFLLAWSDRMWDFCLGLLLVDLGDKTLRLPGIYGFARGGMVLVFCGVLGQWVDKTTRLKAARFCLLAQNGAIVLCSTSLLLTLRFLGRIKDALGGHLEGIIFTLAISLAVVAYMATTGSQIILEKDWIVVISDKNKEHLASMNARMRAIDMVCSFVAPIILGQAMQFSSLEMAAGVVIAWHVGSAMVSYVVLRRIYIALPRLAVKNEVDVEKVDGDINNPDRSDSPQYSAPFNIQAAVDRNLVQLQVEAGVAAQVLPPLAGITLKGRIFRLHCFLAENAGKLDLPTLGHPVECEVEGPVLVIRELN